MLGGRAGSAVSACTRAGGYVVTGALPPSDSGSVTGGVERVLYCWPDMVGVGETAPTPVNVAAVPETAMVPGGTGRMRLARLSIWTVLLKSLLPPAEPPCDGDTAAPSVVPRAACCVSGSGTQTP